MLMFLEMRRSNSNRVCMYSLLNFAKIIDPPCQMKQGGTNRKPYFVADNISGALHVLFFEARLHSTSLIRMSYTSATRSECHACKKSGRLSHSEMA